jgi:hypothetical protein
MVITIPILNMGKLDMSNGNTIASTPDTKEIRKYRKSKCGVGFLVIIIAINPGMGNTNKFPKDPVLN